MVCFGCAPKFVDFSCYYSCLVRWPIVPAKVFGLAIQLSWLLCIFVSVGESRLYVSPDILVLFIQTKSVQCRLIAAYVRNATRTKYSFLFHRCSGLLQAIHSADQIIQLFNMAAYVSCLFGRGYQLWLFIQFIELPFSARTLSVMETSPWNWTRCRSVFSMLGSSVRS